MLFIFFLKLIIIDDYIINSLKNTIDFHKFSVIIIIMNKNYYKNSKKNPDSYCVQKFDGERFDCACDELKCNPTQSWIM